MQSFVMALRSISSNKMRAVLTMLGIIIGVMALVVLVSLVNGATTSVTSTVSDLGNSMVTASISDDKGSPIHLSDLDIPREISFCRRVLGIQNIRKQCHVLRRWFPNAKVLQQHPQNPFLNRWFHFP